MPNFTESKSPQNSEHQASVETRNGEQVALDSLEHIGEAALSTFVINEHDGEIFDVADIFKETHVTLPDSHEATSLLTQAVQGLSEHPTMAAPGNVEYVERDSLSKLSKEARAIVEDLQMQRIQKGFEAGEKYQRGDYYYQLSYEDSAAQDFLRNSQATNDDIVAVLRELSAIEKHVVNVGARTAEPEKREKEYKTYAERSSINLLDILDPKRIVELKNLSGQDGGFVRHMVGEAQKAIDDKVYAGTLEKLMIKAHLEGFLNARERYDAMVAGEIPEDKETLTIGYFDILAQDDRSDVEKNGATWITMEYLSDHLGLTEEFSSEILLSLRLKTEGFLKSESGEPFTSMHKLRREMWKVTEAINEFGVENVNRLRSECGIVNIGELNEEQRRRMMKFMNNDPELLEQLKTREVCVILRDATADWNGSFAGTYESFEPEDGLMLAFEVSSMGDKGKQLQKISQLLADKGVEPSVLIIAGHGMPGGIQLGDGLLVGRTLDDEPEQYATLEESGVDKIIKSMRPDRDGNSHILLNSCSMGATVGTESDDTELSTYDASLDPIYDVEDIPKVSASLNNRPTPDNMLVRTANLAHSQRPDVDFQVVGIDAPGSIQLSRDGELVDRATDQALTRVISPQGQGSGTYRTYEKTVAIPMFQKKQAAVTNRRRGR